MLLTASIPGKTSCKSPVKISALIARFVVAHMVKEAKQRMSLAIAPNRGSLVPPPVVILQLRLAVIFESDV
jgi:hypothetical protein